MTVKIGTVREVTVNGEYKVQVGATKDGGFEAVVTAVHTGTNPLAEAVNSMVGVTTSEWTEVDSIEAYRNLRWQAIGAAVSAFRELENESEETEEIEA